MSRRLMADAGESFCFLAATLASPTSDLVALLRRDWELPGGGSWVADYTDNALLSTLEEEHTRLFVSAFPQLAAPPYAAVYLNAAHPDRLLVRLEERLARLELIPDPSMGERLDHVRCLLEATGRVRNSKARADFVSDFLLPWFRRYRKRLAEAAALPLYSGLIDATHELVVASTKEA